MSERQQPPASARRHIRAELRKALVLDAQLARVIDAVGYPEPRLRVAGFAGLLRVVVAQQLSTKAASAIWHRLESGCAGEVTYRKILRRSEQQLRSCGLSARKVEYAKGLAEAVRTGGLDIAALGAMDTESVVAQLVQLRGFGRWSAEIYAMFALGHRDLYPANDLALQVAVKRYFGLEQRPDAKQTALLSARWSPHRSAVSLLMWKYYGATTLE